MDIIHEVTIGTDDKVRMWTGNELLEVPLLRYAATLHYPAIPVLTAAFAAREHLDRTHIDVGGLATIAFYATWWDLHPEHHPKDPQ